MYLKVTVPFLAVILAVASAGLVGGPVDADMSEEGAQSALQFAMAQYNRQSNDAYVSQVSEVIKVQKQVSTLNFCFVILYTRNVAKSHPVINALDLSNAVMVAKDCVIKPDFIKQTC